MSELVITLVRVACEEVTDDFLEGITDEVGWKLRAHDASGKQVLALKQLPMPELACVAAGSTHELNREILRLGPECREAELEFWDHDTFTPNDLLGRIEISRDGEGALSVRAGKTARDLGEGAFHLTGEHGDYRVWLRFEER
jgi:hypothetical protein